jgi:hypothetical protein
MGARRGFVFGLRGRRSRRRVGDPEVATVRRGRFVVADGSDRVGGFVTTPVRDGDFVVGRR